MNDFNAKIAQAMGAPFLRKPARAETEHDYPCHGRAGPGNLSVRIFRTSAASWQKAALKD